MSNMNTHFRIIFITFDIYKSLSQNPSYALRYLRPLPGSRSKFQLHAIIFLPHYINFNLKNKTFNYTHQHMHMYINK